MPKTVTTARGERRIRVFMVELFVDMPDTPAITFFGSKKAIFEYFGNQALGLSYSHSRNIDFAKKHYANNVCRIEEGELYTLTCSAVVSRREREGRDPMPASNMEGAKKMTAQNKAEG